MRRPVPFAAVATTPLLLCSPRRCSSSELGPGSNKGIPQDLEAVRGLNVLAARGRRGRARARPRSSSTPGAPAAASDPEVRGGGRRARPRARGRSARSRGVAAATRPQFVDPTGRYLHLQAIGRHEYGLPEAQRFVDRLRDEIVPARGLPRGRGGARPAAGRRSASTSSTSRTARSRGSCSRCCCSRTSCSCARSARCCCR